jgi:UDP-N-acetylglucosamine 4-epimerase
VTGAAGFIGSHLVEALVGLEQEVVGLDNFATGKRSNLEDVHSRVGEDSWRRFRFLEGSICDLAVCATACADVDLVLHQAALGSVPRSLADPLGTHAANVNGFVNILLAAREAGCRRFVYASSSSVYGDHPELPKVEAHIGAPLSPYAASKQMGEIYAQVFQRCYGFQAAGLRYFNVLGPRQDPDGAYAAVIPRWISEFRRGERPRIFGDGETSRDFCPVANVIQANLLVATAAEEATGRIYNVALGARTSLNQLYRLIRDELAVLGVPCAGLEPRYEDFRSGDVRHSQADITLARGMLRYLPRVSLQEGLVETVRWFAGTRSLA